LTLIQNDREERVDLGFSGSRLLERLLLIPGEVVSREELMGFAWSDRIVGQGSLNQQIYTLRQVLGDESRREIIQTLPRRGYLLNPSFILQQTVENLPTGIAATPTDSVTVYQPQSAPAPGTPLPTEAEALPIEPRYSAFWPMLAVISLLMCCVALLAIYRGRSDIEFHEEHAQMGKAHVTYLGADIEPLGRLVHHAQPLVAQLAELAEHPVDLIVSSNGEFYQILCRQSDGSARWLEPHRSVMTRVDTEALRRCLR
jgi:DNA-binding winged helix-turn-helix (wHTH) protein